MFSRSKDKDTDKAAAPMAAPAPVPGKRPGTRTAPSIISNDLVVHGNLTATGDIQVDGTVEGDIRSQSLTIGEKASITGEIVAEDIVIRGRVVGTIRGRRVQLSSTCHVEGDILHEALAVETGAFFEGNCRHSDDPIGQASSGASLRPSAPRPGPAANTGSPALGDARPAPRPAPGDSPVVVNDGGVVVKRPAAQ
ncbi:MAG: polymer-forming cytoskeletal protein [Parvibaculum sp.]|nr:polymer-forming cytoskeletal protein [Parvibaculum sp.]